MRRLVCCLMLTCSAAVRSAGAEPVTLVFVGQVTEVPAALAGAFAVGDLAQWQLTYETSQSPMVEFGGTAIYGQSAFSTWQGGIGSQTMGLDPAASFPQQWITRIDGASGSMDRVGYSVNYYGTNSYFMNGNAIGGFRPWAFFSGFELPNGVIPGVSIPGDGAGFQSGTFSMYYRDGTADRNSAVAGRISSVYSVPEPSTLGLLATGAIAFLARRRILGQRPPR